MKTINSFIRVSIYFLGLLWLFNIFSNKEIGLNYLEYGIVWVVILVILLIGISLEVCLEAIKTCIRSIIKEDKKREAYEELLLKANDDFKLKLIFNSVYKFLIGKKVDSTEIETDHNFDGIRELNNNLPTWWLYSFYLTIIFSFIYLAKYHLFDAPNQVEEYLAEVREAKKAIEAYKLTASDFIDKGNVELKLDLSSLAKGKKVYDTYCVACHRSDGGGSIGPNLTDEYWIVGGEIKNIFQVISEGGRDGKGMIAWKSTLKPSEIQNVASYIISLKETNPPRGKQREGTLWSP